MMSHSIGGQKYFTTVHVHALQWTHGQKNKQKINQITHQRRLVRVISKLLLSSMMVGKYILCRSSCVPLFSSLSKRKFIVTQPNIPSSRSFIISTPGTPATTLNPKQVTSLLKEFKSRYSRYSSYNLKP